LALPAIVREEFDLQKIRGRWLCPQHHKAETGAKAKRDAGASSVIDESVEAARGELRNPVMLCGSMFGLETQPYPDGWRLERHRLFETSLLVPQCQHDDRPVVGIYGGHFRGRRRANGTIHGAGRTSRASWASKRWGFRPAR
jgi:hypothetical protein